MAEATAANAASSAIARAKSLTSSVPTSDFQLPPSAAADLQEDLAEASGQVNHLLTENAGLTTAIG